MIILDIGSEMLNLHLEIGKRLNSYKRFHSTPTGDNTFIPNKLREMKRAASASNLGKDDEKKWSRNWGAFQNQITTKYRELTLLEINLCIETLQKKFFNACVNLGEALQQWS